MRTRLLPILAASAALLAGAGLVSSCAPEELPGSAGGEQVLMVSPSLLDLQEGRPVTRAISADELKDDQFNENKVQRLDVFIFKKADGTLVKDYHISGLTPDMIVQRGGKEGYLLTSDWKRDGLDKDVEYKVYVLANSTNETVTAPGAVASETALLALSTTDPDIYKRFKADATASDPTYSNDKTFLMNATVDSWTIPSMSTQLIGDEQLLLERAAVKLVMDVSLSEAFLARMEEDHIQYGRPNWKFVNFNTVTPEVPEGTAPTPALMTRGSGEYLASVAGESGHYTVTTYAYPQSWAGAAVPSDFAPALLLSYTATNTVTGDSNYHYYYIPLCGTVTSTVRNHLYKVTAVISSYGSFEPLNNDKVDLVYEVKDWTATSTEVNAYVDPYLFVTPIRYAFKGGSVGENLSHAFKYYASGTVTISDTRAYYKNYAGTETTVTSGFSVGTPANGEIVVTSTVPTNGTFRTLEFTVNCSGKSQKVIIRHYPVDYVTGITSSWCSYDDNTWAAKGVSGKTYRGSSDSNGSLRYHTSEDDFSATMYYNGGAYYINLNGNRGDRKSSSVNNQMYVLQITSANDTYRIGRPELTEYTGNVYGPRGSTPLKTHKYTLSDDDVLSPAFMLASQLTRLSGTFSTVELAALHCALYKEVDAEGYVYTGWRLPTKQEIQYMIDNQKTNTQVMIEVLTAQYYWALDGTKGKQTDYSGGDGTYVRCVRDVKPEEITRLNEF